MKQVIGHLGDRKKFMDAATSDADGLTIFPLVPFKDLFRHFSDRLPDGWEWVVEEGPQRKVLVFVDVWENQNGRGNVHHDAITMGMGDLLRLNPFYNAFAPVVAKATTAAFIGNYTETQAYALAVNKKTGEIVPRILRMHVASAIGIALEKFSRFGMDKVAASVELFKDWFRVRNADDGATYGAQKLSDLRKTPYGKIWQHIQEMPLAGLDQNGRDRVTYFQRTYHKVNPAMFSVDLGNFIPGYKGNEVAGVTWRRTHSLSMPSDFEDIRPALRALSDPKVSAAAIKALKVVARL